MAGPAVLRRWLEPAGNGRSQIDGRLRQNPAYRPAHIKTDGISVPSVLICGISPAASGDVIYDDAGLNVKDKYMKADASPLVFQ